MCQRVLVSAAMQVRAASRCRERSLSREGARVGIGSGVVWRGCGPKHPTINIQHRTPNGRHSRNQWMLDVGCWLLDVPSLSGPKYGLRSEEETPAIPPL